MMWPENLSSVFYDTLWMKRENCDSASIKSPARTVDWCQKEVANRKWATISDGKA